MHRRLFVALAGIVSASVFFNAACAAAPVDKKQVQAKPAASVSAPDTPDPDVELANQLKQADALYKDGLRAFKSSDTEKGQEDLRKAFDIVIDNLEEDTLPASLHAEFLSMLDKIRNGVDESDTSTTEASALSVSEEALKAAVPASTSAIKMQNIKVDADNPITQKFIDIYTRQRPRAVEEALARSGRYQKLIAAALKEKNLPQELFYLVMAESEYKYNAVSHSGAAGLWQFMPGTARKYGLEVSYWVDERYVPEKATVAAVRYLSDLYQWFGDWNLAIAAYNRGEGGLGRDIQFSRSLDFDSLAGRHALPSETHHYVPKFIACILIGQHPEKFGLHPRYENPEAYDTVTLQRDLDLGIAAKCAQTTEAEIHRLNPQLRTWCTPKDRPDFALRIPKGTKDNFLTNLAKVQDWNPGPTLVRYKVHRGDFLGKIAKQNHTTIRSILETNKIKNPRLIREGMVLLIRPGRHGRHRDLN